MKNSLYSLKLKVSYIALGHGVNGSQLEVLKLAKYFCFSQAKRYYITHISVSILVSHFLPFTVVSLFANLLNKMSAVSIKMPEFSEGSPSTWFVILEAQFQNSNINVSKTKFYHALAKLPVSTVQRITEDIITSEDYDKLKHCVISNFEATKPELFETLLSHTSYTGRPSVYLSEIRQVADKVGVGEDLVRHKFTQAMPQSIRPVLATQKAVPLNALGNLADELLPLCSTNNTVLAIENNKMCPQNTHYMQRNNIQHKGIAPYFQGQRQQVCRAHIYYADNARSCRPWCKWPNKRNVKIMSNKSTTNSTNSSRDHSPSLNK